MNAARNQESIWCLFYIPSFSGKRDRLLFVGSQRSHEATMEVEHLPAFGVACSGELFGKRYTLEALSQRRLPGDTEDATGLQFAGSFEQMDGPSGDFTIAERADGELMTLGLYGTPSSIRVVKVQSSLVTCPVQVTGLGNDIEVCLESPGDPLLSPIAARASMQSFTAANSYVGYCVTKKEYSDETVPMPALLTTFMLISELILRRYYLRVDAS